VPVKFGSSPREKLGAKGRGGVNLISPIPKYLKSKSYYHYPPPPTTTTTNNNKKFFID